MAISFPPVNGSTASDDASRSNNAQMAAHGTVNKNMFLQLLVAQLRNQDPMQPQDGTQFVGQLAQFQQLEQGVNSGQDIAAIRADLDALVAAGKQS